MRLSFIQILSLAVAAWLPAASVQADQLRVSTDLDWSQWDLPGDALKLEGGTLKPTFVRRDLNAMSDAPKFGGGIRAVGTDEVHAFNLIDGDAATSWSPDPDDLLENWWIEVNLGRVVSARKIQLSFAEEGQPLEFFKVFTSDGEPFFNAARTNIPGTVRYNGLTRYSFNQERSIEIDFELKPLQYIRIQADRKSADVHLSELLVDSIGDNLSLGARQRGGDVEIINNLGHLSQRRDSAENSTVIIDGDITTTWGLHFTGVADQTFPEERFGQFTVDLGAVFWVDRVRILGDATGINPGAGTRSRDRAFNYLWYKLTGSDGSRSPDGSLLWTVLGERLPDKKNLKEVVRFEERFPLQKLRYFRLLFPMTDNLREVSGRIGTTAEIQIFGEGHPAEVLTRSPLYDLGNSMNISSIEWAADIPPASWLEIRTRTGNLLEEEYKFYDKDGKEVTQKRWEKLIPSFKGPIDTLRSPGADWSNWSRAYQVSGQTFLSPVPRRYVQLEVIFFSEDPFSAASLDELTLHFGPSLADSTQAEIFPAETVPGKRTHFTYFLRAVLTGSSQGFDQIMLTSEAEIDFKELRVEGEAVPVDIEEVEKGVKVTLDRPVRRSSLIEADFESTLFFNQTRFEAFLFNSRVDSTIRQQVDPGNASEEIESEGTSVSLPTDHPLIGNIALARSAFTPNGDGIGDRLHLGLNLFQVLTPRPLEVSIYDLSGRQVHLLSDRAITAGPVVLEWDGRDAAGQLLPPGLYILRIEIRGDAQTATDSRLIAVVY